MASIRAGSTSHMRVRNAIPPFQAFLEEHRTRVYRFLLASVGPNDADDCFQETFLSALRAYPRLRDGSNLRGWIMAIATHKVIDAGRKRARRPVLMADMADLAEAAEGPAAEAPKVPAAEADAFDGDHPVWKAVRALPPRQRAAVVHRVVLDQPYAEIARALECSEETARANVYQGMKKLREARSGG